MFILDDSLGFLVNKAALAMKRALEERLASSGLTAPQWAVIARLWENDGQPQVSICRSLFFDKPTVTGIITRLEKKGLVKRERDTEDGRVFRVYLTREGRGLEEKLIPLARGVNKLALEGISGQEKKILMECLEKIWKNIKE